jgi:hypothetical protein
MDKCLICQRVYDLLVKPEDDPNCDFCDRRWCTDCADAGNLYALVVEDNENKIKCFLCVLGERNREYCIRYRYH